jgi:hypothetical protein
VAAPGSPAAPCVNSSSHFSPGCLVRATGVPETRDPRAQGSLRRTEQCVEAAGEGEGCEDAVLCPVLFGQEPGFWGSLCLTVDPDGITGLKWSVWSN